MISQVWEAPRLCRGYSSSLTFSGVSKLHDDLKVDIARAFHNIYQYIGDNFGELPGRWMQHRNLIGGVSR